MSEKHKKSKSTLLPNITLIFAFFYFGFIIESEPERHRKNGYVLLLIVDVIALVIINFSKLKAIIKDLKEKYFSEKPKKEKIDVTKEYVE
jgi:hypothetical protein